MQKMILWVLISIFVIVPSVSNAFQLLENNCLSNKNYGKNLTAAEKQSINAQYNKPSPFTFGSMIGLNDGGLVFRSFQGETNIQITQLTTQFRNFHTMDEDFDLTLNGYGNNVKPKDTWPEGTPSGIWYNQLLYKHYRNKLGFQQIAASTEVLQYHPQSWKDKMFRENDWSLSGPSGILNSYKNYTRSFIQHMAPANGQPADLLVSYYQVGNELWDYPVKADYHSLLMGAHAAFVDQYGAKSGNNWKMKLVAGAFQAFRDNNCPSGLRNVSNCDGSLERHDFIGDYLDVPQCDVLRDLDAIDCHPYSFKPGTLSWTHPEDPQSEVWQIRNLAAWRDANQDSTSGVLMKTRLWSSEFGFDSNPTTGVGEQTQAAYVLRGLLLHSRFHFEKVFFYNAFDVVQPNSQYYTGLYNSSGFWKAGANPMNNAWASPLVAHGAQAKPVWHTMMDFKARLGEHVFTKVLSETDNLNAYLLAKPDGSEPYIVFWSPKATNDDNMLANESMNVVIDWSAALGNNYKIADGGAQMFATTGQPSGTFQAAVGTHCGFTTLALARRSPAFIRLVACDGLPTACDNVTQAGALVAPSAATSTAPFQPASIVGSASATGGTGALEYQWQISTDGGNFQHIVQANGADYAPGVLQHTTYFRRGAKRANCPDFLFTQPVKIEVTVVSSSDCPTDFQMRRVQHSNPGCNVNGDFYYEITVDNITKDQKILIEGLPTNGLNTTMTTLNGNNLTAITFHKNLQYVLVTSFNWKILASNGTSQQLRIYFCWANYPATLDNTHSTLECNGTTAPCAQGLISGDADDRSDAPDETPVPGRLQLAPNPGSAGFTIGYDADDLTDATLTVFNQLGQVIVQQAFTTGSPYLAAEDWATGLYYVKVQTAALVRQAVWVKQR